VNRCERTTNRPPIRRMRVEFFEGHIQPQPFGDCAKGDQIALAPASPRNCRSAGAPARRRGPRETRSAWCGSCQPRRTATRSRCARGRAGSARGHCPRPPPSRRARSGWLRCSRHRGRHDPQPGSSPVRRHGHVIGRSAAQCSMPWLGAGSIPGRRWLPAWRPARRPVAAPDRCVSPLPACPLPTTPPRLLPPLGTVLACENAVSRKLGSPSERQTSKSSKR
jgi:hypothetical protein